MIKKLIGLLITACGIAGFIYLKKRKTDAIDSFYNHINITAQSVQPKPKDINISNTIDNIIAEIDRYYEEHKLDENDNTNYNIPGSLRLLKAKYAATNNFEDNYCWKQMAYALDELRN